jgi:hypothetical protein
LLLGLLLLVVVSVPAPGLVEADGVASGFVLPGRVDAEGAGSGLLLPGRVEAPVEGVGRVEGEGVGRVDGEVVGRVELGRVEASSVPGLMDCPKTNPVLRNNTANDNTFFISALLVVACNHKNNRE